MQLNEILGRHSNSELCKLLNRGHLELFEVGKNDFARNCLPVSCRQVKVFGLPQLFKFNLFCELFLYILDILETAHFRPQSKKEDQALIQSHSQMLLLLVPKQRLGL